VSLQLASFRARSLRPAGVLILVLVRLARDRGLQVEARAAVGQSRGGIAHGFQVLEMALSMAALARIF